ncbi:MAG TPA: translation factor GTPase family protein [Gaiellaceae bacterium]|nr:translation factor GTPase family protein [Gaiellaceae bacterium]
MLGRTLNLGILAHVDAGKTTLTERLLYDGGAIRSLGSVDRGTTQTDTLELERRRGITIRAAVASFAIGGVRVNLIDTPGHPDFIAEVERVLAVLDGAVLVVSAVEGVQAQTLVLMRALRRLAIPTVLFVSKTDREGADVERVLREIRQRLSPDALPVWALDPADLAERDEALLTAYVAGDAFDVRAVLDALARRSVVYPVLAGSALTGEGLDALRRAIVRLLPPEPADADGPPVASVFKIERDARGERIAYLRLFAGTLHARERVGDDKVTELAVFEPGGAVQRPLAVAGEIAKVHGLRSVRVGDRIGPAPGPAREFPPPTLESVVRPDDPADAQRLRVALDQLAEQDPLIHVRQAGAELSVSLYGEVQKEVIGATLADEHGLAVSFRETTPIYVERPVGAGEALEALKAPTNPFPRAQLALRVEPAEGVHVRVEIADHTRVPLYIYKRREAFEEALDSYVREALRTGLHDREVIDCAVTVVDSWYTLADGPPSRRDNMPVAADFHGLAPVVLRRALERAGVVVCEPVMRVRLEIPADTAGIVLAAAVRLGTELDAPLFAAGTATVEGELAAVHVAELQRGLHGLTRGEGVLETTFAGYRPAVNAVPG